MRAGLVRQLSSQLDPQPPPRPRVRRRGLGDGLADFNALMASGNSQVNSAWDQINTQLVNDYGAGTEALAGAQLAAQGTFASAFDQISQLGAASGLDPSQYVSAAQQYVMWGQTIAGAVAHVQGMIAAGAPPAQVAQAFMGTMIGTFEGVAVSAGAISAGVGAVIVAAAGAILDALQQAGLFGSTPSGVRICPGVTVNNVPSWMYYDNQTELSPASGDPGNQVCVGFYGAQVSPGSPNWRSFPDPLDPNDSSQWYACPATIGNWGPAGAPLGCTVSCGNDPYSPDTDKQPIAFQVFPELYQLIMQNGGLSTPYVPNCPTPNVPAQVAQFQQMFFNAWKTNRAFVLNGLQAQPDWRVLLQTANIWNSAHPGGPYYTFAPAGAQATYAPYGSSCPQYPYESILATTLQDQNSTLSISLAPLSSARFVGQGPSTGQIAAAVAGGAVAAGLLGLGVYSTVANVSLGYAAGKVLDKLFSWVKG